jgi:hypothetical protein
MSKTYSLLSALVEVVSEKDATSGVFHSAGVRATRSEKRRSHHSTDDIVRPHGTELERAEH